MMRRTSEFKLFFTEAEIITAAAGWAVGMVSIDLINAFVNDMLWPLILYIRQEVVHIGGVYNPHGRKPLSFDVSDLMKAVITWLLSVLTVFLVIHLFLNRFLLRFI